MLKKKILNLSMMSMLLTTTVFSASAQNCVGGVCFINLDNLKPSKGFEQNKQNLIVLEQPRYIQGYTTEDNIDKSVTIVLDGETITVFPKSTYVMTEEEKNNYLANEAANKDLLMLMQSVEKVEDKIIEKSDLPSSEFFCEKKTKPVYNKSLGSFQCV